MIKENNKINDIEYESLSDKVYNRITEAILNNSFQSGERIVINKIAKYFNVSSSPVREAIVKLEREGFIYSIPRSGKFISSISNEDLEEIYDIRALLEGFAIKKISLLDNQELIKKLVHTCNQYETGLKKKDIDLCLNNDNLFHETLAEATKNKRLIEILKNFHLLSISIAKKENNYWENAPLYLQEHKKILEFISAADYNSAEAEVQQHIIKGKGRIL